MTSNDTPKHTPTIEQQERQWGLEQARSALLTSRGGALFTQADQGLAGSYTELTLLAEWLIGELVDPVDASTPAQRANELVDELDPKSATKVGMHALSHSELPLVLMSNMPVLAALDDEVIAKIVESSREGLAELPRLIEEYRSRPKPETFDTFLESVREQFEAEQNLATAEEDGSLVVDEKQAEKRDGEAQVAAEPKADDRG